MNETISNHYKLLKHKLKIPDDNSEEGWMIIYISFFLSLFLSLTLSPERRAALARPPSQKKKVRNSSSLQKKNAQYVPQIFFSFSLTFFLFPAGSDGSGLVNNSMRRALQFMSLGGRGGGGSDGAASDSGVGGAGGAGGVGGRSELLNEVYLTY